jgi:PAS domain S-box-containing protein
MKSQEPFASSGAAMLLRQLTPKILSEFSEILQGRKLKDSCLQPELPALLDAIQHSLLGEEMHGFSPPPAWVQFPLASLISELSILRDILARSLRSQKTIQRMHQFLDHCLEAAASSRDHIEHEAMQRLFSFFRLLPTPVCVVTGPEKRITFANNAYETFLGRAAQGRTLAEVFDADELKRYLPVIENVYQYGTPCFVNEVYVPVSIGKTGKERWVDASYYPLGNMGLSVRGVIAVHYEVTDRVVNRRRRERSEERLRQTEEQLVHAMTVSKVGFFDWDFRGHLIHMNRQMRKDWGLDESLLTPDELEALIHPDDRTAMQTGIRLAIEQHTPYAAHCRVVRSHDKKVIWIEIQGEITYDDENRPLRFFGTSRNITERKEAELKLFAEKHKFEVIFRDSPAPMALCKGEDFIFELVNPQFENFFQDRHFLGKTLHEALPELADQPFLDLVRKVYESGETFSAREFLVKIARCEGGHLEDCFLDFSFTRILDDEGKPYGVFSHIVNVTDRIKARDEARAASLSKSHFLANMSHEIRTPLAAILGFSALLRDPQLPESEREVFVDTIVRNGESLTRLIDDILDLAKVEAGRLEMEVLDFSLPGLIQEVLLLFRDRAQQKKLQLSADIRSGVPERIASDPLRLRQILVNLLGNAVKFTAKGFVEIVVQAAWQVGAWRICIEVKDSGIGLTPEQRERLFQPFTQADHSTTRKYGGTGLGLALSQRLAEALGGRISIAASEAGKGSTFRLEFVAGEARPATEPSRKAPAQVMDPLQLHGVRVLVVDDSPDNLFLVKNFLAKSGAVVATAASGQQALELAAAHSYELILLDIQMPEMDGYQTLKRLREQDFQKPIVALTAHAMADERQHTQEAGFHAHLTKPLDAVELVATVARLARPSSNVWLGGNDLQA